MWPDTELECIPKPSGQDPRQDVVVSVQLGSCLGKVLGHLLAAEPPCPR
jgi:hypothetical protein